MRRVCLVLMLLMGCDAHAAPAKWPDTKWPPDKDPVYQRKAPKNPFKWLDRNLTPPPEKRGERNEKTTR